MDPLNPFGDLGNSLDFKQDADILDFIPDRYTAQEHNQAG